MSSNIIPAVIRVPTLEDAERAVEFFTNHPELDSPMWSAKFYCNRYGDQLCFNVDVDNNFGYCNYEWYFDHRDGFTDVSSHLWLCSIDDYIEEVEGKTIDVDVSEFL